MLLLNIVKLPELEALANHYDEWKQKFQETTSTTRNKLIDLQKIHKVYTKKISLIHLIYLFTQLPQTSKI